MQNSNCDNTLHEVQVATAQTRYYSYTSAQRNLWLPIRGSDPLNCPSLCYRDAWTDETKCISMATFAGGNNHTVTTVYK